MNWLAHILLSKRDIEYQLGNLLADLLKGKAWEGASASFIDGESMHKAIDIFTDSHPIVSASKTRLGKKGYLKGVVMDVLYDHFLTISWGNFSELSLLNFIAEFNLRALETTKEYPEEPKEFVNSLVASDRLAKYGSFEGFVSALQRIDSRLSPRIRACESTESYIIKVESNYENLRNDFANFFPELVSFFKEHELGCKVNNHLI
jgi:acyl carrier protein phosphodiesterase